MKKRAVLLLLVMVCAVIMAGCGCEHQWKEADCVTPKTCTLCAEIEGTPLGHNWQEATCTDPKTCSACKAVDGPALGHTMTEATCTEASTCEVCNFVDGDPLGHDWQDATTETPKTCLTCNVTEGERIITDPRFTTASAAELLGRWECPLELYPEALGVNDFEEDLFFFYILEFGPAGDFHMSMDFENWDIFMEFFIQMAIETTYAEFLAQGHTVESADAAMQDEMGMNVDEYVRALYEEMDMSTIMATMFGVAEIEAVYYVEDGQIYIGTDWESEMEPSPYTLGDGWLFVDAMTEIMGIEADFYYVGK